MKVGIKFPNDIIDTTTVRIKMHRGSLYIFRHRWYPRFLWVPGWRREK